MKSNASNPDPEGPTLKPTFDRLSNAWSTRLSRWPSKWINTSADARISGVSVGRPRESKSSRQHKWTDGFCGNSGGNTWDSSSRLIRWARALAWAFRVMPVSTTMDQEPMSG